MAGNELFAVSGAKIYIGAALAPKNADFVLADFSGQTWVEIDGWKTAGTTGDSAEEINTQLINRGRATKQKGTRDAGTMENTFAIIGGDAGQAALKAAEKTKSNYAFKIVYADTPTVKASTVTITIAAPGVISWTAHGLAEGTPVKLTTTGALPTGLTAATTYYVKSPTTDAFSLSATSGGAAITTSSTQSGTHTATTVPAPSEERFIALVMSAMRAGGEANATMDLTVSLSVNSIYVETAALG